MIFYDKIKTIGVNFIMAKKEIYKVKLRLMIPDKTHYASDLYKH